MVFIHLFIKTLLDSTSRCEVGHYVRLSPTGISLPLGQRCLIELSVLVEMSSLCTGGKRTQKEQKKVPASRSLNH